MCIDQATARLPKELREATKVAHRLLDHHPILNVLLRDTLSISDYSKALAALHGANAAIEKTLEDFAPRDLFPFRVPDMEDDLNRLGWKPYPLTVPVPTPQMTAEKIGLMYVIEGSNLGGAVIARQIENSLPEDAPQRFFRGAGGTERWQNFWQFAETHCPDDQVPHAIQGALATFAFYRHHLDSVIAKT